MLYFAYGSNMSTRRLQARVPSARFVTLATLSTHRLQFHKKSLDGSAKCNIQVTNNTDDRVCGVVFDIAEEQKPALDQAEGLGYGYEIQMVQLLTPAAEPIMAFTYLATLIDAVLLPYDWYKHHVLTGAQEHGLPADYVDRIRLVESVLDPDTARHTREMAIYRL